MIYYAKRKGECLGGQFLFFLKSYRDEEKYVQHKFAKLMTVLNLYFLFQNSQNTVTHADPSERDSLEFEWEAPDYYEGSIVFV
jgi:hypothetical protein